MNLPALYIHIPFCERKCLFCSFAIAVGQKHRREEYVSALIAEMKKYEGTAVSTVYFGGGTPSMLEEDHFDFLMSAIRKNFSLKSTAEIAIEANPESVDDRKAKALKALGFNRISLGVQSLNDRYLKFLGRAHDAETARSAYRSLREAGFENINLDLMYAFPGQTDEELGEDVRAIAALKSEHLSLYTLTIEPNSRFYAKQMKLDDDEKCAAQYVLIGELLRAEGFEQYEISNFAKPGFQSAHNKNYWLGGAYIGLGMGAHGFTGRRRAWNTPRLQDYIECASSGQDAVEGFEDLTDEQIVMEKVLFGLRMNEGIPISMLPSDRQKLVDEWINDGLLELHDQKLKTTNKGRLVLDELSVRLI